MKNQKDIVITKAEALKFMAATSSKLGLHALTEYDIMILQSWMLSNVYLSVTQLTEAINFYISGYYQVARPTYKLTAIFIQNVIINYNSYLARRKNPINTVRLDLQ